MYTKEDVLAFIRNEGVKFVRLAFITQGGQQKNISIMAARVELAFEKGVRVDPAVFDAALADDDAKLFLHPEPATLAILPWRPVNGKVVRMFCDITDENGTPYQYDTRATLRCTMEKAKNDGYAPQFDCRALFSLSKIEQEKKVVLPYDIANLMDIAPKDTGENIRREICFAMDDMGITPTASYHAALPGQNEIDFVGGDALATCDNIATVKWIIGVKAAAYGLLASFDNISYRYYSQTDSYDFVAVNHFSVSSNDIADRSVVISSNPYIVLEKVLSERGKDA